MTNIDSARLVAAYEKSRDELLAQRNQAGHWEGELSNSALSTATAVSALALVDSHGQSSQHTSFQRLIAGGVQWLVEQQNADGGWGDTDKSYSNIATTMLVVAAIHLSGEAETHAE